MASALENVKTMIGIDDSLQDPAIQLIINNVQAHLGIWLKKYAGLDSIPLELLFIVEEMAIVRFNRRGSEGAKSESVEGHSVTYNEDDFLPYLPILNTYIPVTITEKPGKVMFF